MASGIKNFRHLLRNVDAGRRMLLAACVLGININSTKAEDAYVCKLFAREYLREIYVHNLKKTDTQSVDSQQKAIPDTTDTTKLPFYYQKLIATCLAADKIPDLPDVPEATDKVWLDDLVGSHLSNQRLRAPWRRQNRKVRRRSKANRQKVQRQSWRPSNPRPRLPAVKSICGLLGRTMVVHGAASNRARLARRRQPPACRGSP